MQQLLHEGETRHVHKEVIVLKHAANRCIWTGFPQKTSYFLKFTENILCGHFAPSYSLSFFIALEMSKLSELQEAQFN